MWKRSSMQYHPCSALEPPEPRLGLVPLLRQALRRQEPVRLRLHQKHPMLLRRVPQPVLRRLWVRRMALPQKPATRLMVHRQPVYRQPLLIVRNRPTAVVPLRRSSLQIVFSYYSPL